MLGPVVADHEDFIRPNQLSRDDSGCIPAPAALV
jgi:hypothetical protein